MRIYESEKEYINLLESKNIKYVLQPKRFSLKSSTYTPDFFLPETKTYVELVGTRQAYHANKRKYKEFMKMYPDVKFEIVTKNGKPYRTKKQASLLTLDEYIDNIQELKNSKIISNRYRDMLIKRIAFLKKIQKKIKTKKMPPVFDDDIVKLTDDFERKGGDA